LENMVTNPAFWSGKAVLITGHTGFKGSWLSMWLQQLGANVLGYSLAPPTEPNMFNVAQVAARMTSLTGDVRDPDHLKQVITDYRPEIVIHMAAQSLVRHSYADPIETYSINVMGTVNVLEAVRHSDSVRVVVNVTSDKCYENKGWIWGYREEEPMGGHDPYSSSKGCSELVTSAYRRSYFSDNSDERRNVGVATARCGNVVGGGDWAPDRLVPDVMLALAAGKSVSIRNPGAIRPWQHVLDSLSGYFLLAEKLWHDESGFSGGWNFGSDSNDAKTVSWVVDRMIMQWGEGRSWAIDTAENPHEAQFLKLDCTKSRALLGWSPKLRVTDALDWTTEWYKSFEQKKDMNEMTTEQILRFQELG